MANSSPSATVRQIDNQVGRILRQVNWARVDQRTRLAVEKLRQNLIDAKIYSQDYELSEMREEQLDNAKKTKRFLSLARRQILRASEFNVFSAIDVAHLTAQIDLVKASLI